MWFIQCKWPIGQVVSGGVNHECCWGCNSHSVQYTSSALDEQAGTRRFAEEAVFYCVCVCGSVCTRTHLVVNTNMCMRKWLHIQISLIESLPVFWIINPPIYTFRNDALTRSQSLYPDLMVFFLSVRVTHMDLWGPITLWAQHDRWGLLLLSHSSLHSRSHPPKSEPHTHTPWCCRSSALAHTIIKFQGHWFLLH